jgi:hypothetical protein
MLPIKRGSESRRTRAFWLIVFALALLTSLGGCAWIQNWLNPSPPTELKRISEEDAGTILDTQVAGLETYERLKEQENPDALVNTVSWLRTQPEVSDSRVAPDGNISILYECGLIGTLLIHTPTTLDTRDSISSAVYGTPKTFSPRENPVSLRSTWATSPGNKRAIVLLPFQRLSRKVDTNRLIGDLESAGYSVDGPFVNDEVTVELMKTLNQYGVIYIITHGGCVANFPFHPLRNQVEILTGQEAYPTLLVGVWNDIATNFKPGIGIVTTLPPDKASYFCVFGDFVDDLSYPNSFVVINACNSFANDSLADAFLKSGVTAYFGWTSITCDYFVDQVTRAMFDLAVKPNRGVIEAYKMPYSFEDWGTYSINQLFPGTFYKDRNEDGYALVCYSNGKCGGDEDDIGAEKDFETDFKYKLKGGLVDLVLNSAINRPPTATITSPTDHLTFNEGTLITFEGEAPDPEDGALSGSSLVWTSSIDGQIGTGESFSTSSLSVGTHTITLTATDSDGGSSSTSINITVSSVGPTLPPPGPSEGKIAFVSDRDRRWGEIYVMDPDGSNVQRITYTSPGWGGVSSPTWSPDGREIAFLYGGGAGICIMNTDGTNMQKMQFASLTCGMYSLNWSPDGTKFAFVACDGIEGYNIYTANIDGSHLQKLTNDGNCWLELTWSPDGRIAFASNRGPERIFKVYVMNADGTNQHILPNFPSSTSSPPVWSPDGTKLAYVSGGDAIWIMNADGSGQIRLTNDTVWKNCYHPSWSPDGNKIVFETYEYNEESISSGIYVISTDGRGLSKLSGNNDIPTDPAWSPAFPTTSNATLKSGSDKH